MPRKPASNKTLSSRVLVNIHRDNTTVTPRVAWQHELPILSEIFGEGNVREVDPETLNEGYSKAPSPALLIWNKQQDPILPPSETAGIGFVFFGDPRPEYERLVQVYGKHKEINVSLAEHVYGRFQENRFSRVVGTAEVEDLPEQQLRDIAKQYGHLPILGEKATAEEKKAAAELHGALYKMKHDELVALVRDLGFELAAA